jgi:DNA-binding transcriptional MerR regulator
VEATHNSSSPSGGSNPKTPLPPIPAKRYFTIGEVSELCGVKPHVLRYWEQEFTQLKPVKRRGNRRYYQHHEVLLIRRIRELLYEQGFTISGARNRLTEAAQARQQPHPSAIEGLDIAEDADEELIEEVPIEPVAVLPAPSTAPAPPAPATLAQVREELLSIRQLLTP